MTKRGGWPEPEAGWQIVEPGVLELPPPRMRIVHVAGSTVPFRIQHDGHTLGQRMVLLDAQRHARHLLAEMLHMGIEP